MLSLHFFPKRIISILPMCKDSLFSINHLLQLSRLVRRIRPIFSGSLWVVCGLLCENLLVKFADLLTSVAWEEYFSGGSHFSWREILFLGRNFHFGWPKQISVFSKSETTTRTKRRKVLCSFSYFSPFHFKFSTFPFTIFLLFFSILPG